MYGENFSAAVIVGVENSKCYVALPKQISFFSPDSFRLASFLG